MSARDGHRVGLLFSRESLTAATEITQENATRMAIDEVNAAGGIDGVPLTPISAGVGAQPPDYRQAAEWLCDAQRVPLIFGSHMSSTRKAVLPVVESRRACSSTPRCTRVSSIRPTASTPDRCRTRIPCSWPAT